MGAGRATGVPGGRPSEVARLRVAGGAALLCPEPFGSVTLGTMRRLLPWIVVAGCGPPAAPPPEAPGNQVEPPPRRAVLVIVHGAYAEEVRATIEAALRDVPELVIGPG